MIVSRGLLHVNLNVADAEHSIDFYCNVLERVEAHDGSIIKQGNRGVASLGEAFAYVRDPDGYAIEVATQAILYAEFRKSQLGTQP